MNYIIVFLLTLLNLTYILSLMCPHGYFSLDNYQCQSWLNCKDIKDLTLGSLIGYGSVKKIYESTWNQFPVAVVFINNPSYIADFSHGLELLIKLNPSKYMTLLIGICKESNVYVTKYYDLGPLKHFEDFLPIDHYGNFKTRFKLCLNYIEIINYFHSFKPPYAMCDTNTLNKTLEQYLLSDFDVLVLNDIDALTQVNNGIICGHKEIGGTFVAPEQLWPYQGKYEHRRMPKYDEKIDLWKIPSVCQHILGNSNEAVTVRYHLFNINKKCRNPNSLLRPNSTDVLEQYREVYNYILNKEEL